MKPVILIFTKGFHGDSMGIPCSSSTRHVMARNYSGAPRFCPGYQLSMKVAKEVCAQFTKVQRIAAGPTKSVLWMCQKYAAGF